MSIKPLSRNKVGLIIIAVFVLIMAFDAFLYSDGLPGNSITQTIIHYSEKSKLVPYFIGYLMGFLAAHFFDDYKEPRGPNGEV